MIDFEKELSKFHFMDLDEDLIQQQSDSSIALTAFQNTLKRLGREQSKTNTHLEEIIGLMEDERHFISETAALKESLAALENEQMTLIKGFITILDQIEDLYRYSTRSSDYSWSKQLELLWSNISNILMSMGIMKIDGENTRYNKNLHIAEEIRSNPENDDGIILEVLSCGYIYKACILRKAKVVVNKIADLEE